MFSDQLQIVLLGADTPYVGLQGEEIAGAILTIFPIEQSEAIVQQLQQEQDPPPNLILLLTRLATLDRQSAALKQLKESIKTDLIPVVVLLDEDLIDLAPALYRARANCVVPERRLLDDNGKVVASAMTELCGYWTERAL